MTVRELIIKISLQDPGDTAKRQSQKIESAFQRMNASVDAFGRSLASIGRRAGIIFGSVGIASGAVAAPLIKLSQLASQDTSALNVLGVAFGNLSRETEHWARGLARDFGAADSDLINLSSQMQISLADITGSIDKSAELTKTLAPLGIGLARAFGRPIEDALFAITRGIQGEEEQLRKFGVQTTDSALKTFALTMGIKESVSAMTQNQKALLRTQKILRDTQKFQSFTTKGLDTFSGASTALSGRLKTLGATIGSNVEAPMVSATTALRGFVEASIQALRDQGPISKKDSPLVDLLQNIKATSAAIIGIPVKSFFSVLEFFGVAVQESMQLKLALAGVGTAVAAIFAPVSTLLIGLFLLADDIRGLFSGQKSLVGSGIDKVFGEGAAGAAADEVKRVTGILSSVLGQVGSRADISDMGPLEASAAAALRGVAFTPSLEQRFPFNPSTAPAFRVVPRNITVNQTNNVDSARAAEQIGQSTAGAIEAISRREELRRANQNLSMGN